MLVEPRTLRTLWRRVRQAAAVRPYGFQLWQSFHYADDHTKPLVARAAGDWVRGLVFRDKARRLPPQDLVSRSGVVVLLADFFRELFEAGRGHTVSMPLTFSAWLERHG